MYLNVGVVSAHVGYRPTINILELVRLPYSSLTRSLVEN